VKCQQIFRIKWHNFTQNTEVSLRTGLRPVSDRITGCWNTIFGHVQGHQSVGFATCPNMVFRPLVQNSFYTRLCNFSSGFNHSDSLKTSYRSKAFESDAITQAHCALTTTTNLLSKFFIKFPLIFTEQQYRRLTIVTNVASCVISSVDSSTNESFPVFSAYQSNDA